MISVRDNTLVCVCMGVFASVPVSPLLINDKLEIVRLVSLSAVTAYRLFQSPIWSLYNNIVNLDYFISS